MKHLYTALTLAILSATPAKASVEYFRCMTKDFNNNWVSKYSSPIKGAGVRVLVIKDKSHDMELREMISLPGSALELGNAGNSNAAEKIGGCIENGKECVYELTLWEGRYGTAYIPTDIAEDSEILVVDNSPSKGSLHYKLKCIKD